MSNIEKNKRIAKNTLLLYFRLFLTMGVALYTSRVVLNTLGLVDFGVYSVVGSVVTMFSFLNGALSTATQRFFSVELGKQDYLKLKKVFSVSLSIHALLSIVIVILAETIGLWFLNTQMNIPSERMDAANWVYQFSVFSFALSVIQVPYNALIISREKMDIYAYVSIVEVLLRLLIVFILVWFGYDKLKLYSVLIFVVSFIVLLIYRGYCHRKFKECHYKFYKDKSLYISLTSFSSWSLFGSLSWVMMGEGLNIMLNIFFGSVLNASRGIAFQVNMAVSSFVNNFRIAVNPQIVKSCAIGDKVYMSTLLFESAKFSFYLLLLLTLPILLETKTILHVWLKLVPEYSVFFCQLVLINSLIQCFDIGIVFTAIGKIKENQFIGGFVYLLILPISYYLLKLGNSPEIIFYVQISATIFVVFGVNIYLLNKIADIRPMQYFKQLFIPVIKVLIVACVIPILIRIFMDEGFERLVLLLITSSLSVILTVYFIGMNHNMRISMLNAFNNKLDSFKKSFLKL